VRTCNRSGVWYGSPILRTCCDRLDFLFLPLLILRAHCRHTHGWVDQVFSCISRFLARKDARTIEELAKRIQESYTCKEGLAEIQIRYLDEAADVKEWLNDHAAKVSNITGSQQYKFEMKDVEGKPTCVLSCKQFAATSDDKWVSVGPMLKVRTKARVPPFFFFFFRPEQTACEDSPF